MSKKIVRAALESALNTWATANSLTVAWENVAFTPPAGAYIRAFIIPSPTTSESLERADRRYSGLLQVDLMMPINGGSGPAETLLESLSAAFNPANVLTRSGVRINILQPASDAAAIPEENRHVIPVTVPYEATVY
ncbi:MAG TPA: phage tail terminator-like protein [Burkholderiaceae bacterium]